MLLVNTFTGQSLSTFLLHGTLCAPGSRISDSPSLRHDNNILSTDNAIFPGQRGTEETKGMVATLSRLFSISSYRGCSVFLPRSAEFKGMKYRSLYFIFFLSFFFPSPRPSDYRPRLSAPFRFRDACSRRFAIKYFRSTYACSCGIASPIPVCDQRFRDQTREIKIGGERRQRSGGRKSGKGGGQYIVAGGQRYIKKKKVNLSRQQQFFRIQGFATWCHFGWFVEKKKRKKRLLFRATQKGIADGYSRWGKPIRKSVVNRLQDKILFAGRKTLFGGGWTKERIAKRSENVSRKMRLRCVGRSIKVAPFKAGQGYVVFVAGWSFLLVRSIESFLLPFPLVLLPILRP